ncbi:Late transcription factor VLTF-4 (1), partial [Monkeypox virus]
DLKVATDN